MEFKSFGEMLFFLDEIKLFDLKYQNKNYLYLLLEVEVEIYNEL